jgi:dihydropteroate synthase
MIEQGVEIIDVGDESTRPNADPVSVVDEIQRIIPVIEALIKITDTPISIDTSKPEVMRQAVKAGVSMINDVYALRADGALSDSPANNGKPKLLNSLKRCKISKLCL